MQRLLAQNPPTTLRPWRLILYSDGITPGDGFKVNNDRKADVIYFSIMEFGAAVLCHEDAWFMVIAKRSNQASKIGGGLSAILAHV